MRAWVTAFVGIAIAAGAATDVGAACITARSVSSKNPTGISLLYTPGHPFGPYGAANNRPRGVFWSLGYGNATDATPPNNDSGANSGGTSYVPYGGASNWLEVGYYGDGSYIGDHYNSAHWQYPGTDGCIDWDGSDGNHTSGGAQDADQCNVVLLDDDDDDGTGYFLLVSQSASPGGDYFMNQALGNQNVDLVPIPVPQVVGTVRVTPLIWDVTIVVPCPVGPAEGVYANCSSPQNDQLASSIEVQLYGAVTAIGARPNGPGSRDLPSVAAVTDGGNPAGWQPVTGGSGACGTPLNVQLFIASDSGTTLCSSLVVDGFETTNCSGNSVQLHDPGLADPGAPVIRRDKPEIERRGSARDGRRGDRGR